MALRSIVVLATTALWDEEEDDFTEADVDGIVGKLETEGVEELCDICLAYGDDAGAKAAIKFAESCGVNGADRVLRYIAASVSKEDLASELSAQAPAPKRRKRFVQDGRVVTDYADLVAAKCVARPARIRGALPASFSRAVEGAQSSIITRAILAAEAAANLEVSQAP